MKIIDCVQGSDEWYQARCGIPTSSNFDKIITTKGEKSKQREKFLYRLVGERLLGKPGEEYQSEFMQRGKEIEAEAKAVYEVITGETITQVGLCLLNAWPKKSCKSKGCYRLRFFR